MKIYYFLKYNYVIFVYVVDVVGKLLAIFMFYT